MRNFMETLANRHFDLRLEITNLWALLERQNNNNTSINSIASSNFLSWKFRNNYIEYVDFLGNTGISDILHRARNGYNCSLDDFIYFSEFVVNIVDFVHGDKTINDLATPVVENTKNIIHKNNLVIKKFDDGSFKIIEKDPYVAEAAEIVQDEYNLGEDIYLYNHNSNKGNLISKSDVLCRLYKYYEKIEPQARQFGLSDLMSDVSALTNKFDLRHAPTEKQKTVIEGMTSEEVESWYDNLFKLYLSLIILVDYKSNRKDIKELKTALG